MPEGNCTALTEFILLGFPDRPEVEIPLFGLFLLIYGTTVVGNVCLVVLVWLNARLHTPMYDFLSNLAFHTCSSHLAAVGLFYGSLLFTYLKPSSSLGTDKAVSALYTLVFPMLNPLIYSLRNKEVKDALRRTLERRFS